MLAADLNVLASPSSSSSAPFSEDETRLLIRLRQEMHQLFQEKNRKRGVHQLYVAIAERLHELGKGAWPLRTHNTVAQKWNNLIGTYKVRVSVCV